MMKVLVVVALVFAVALGLPTNPPQSALATSLQYTAADYSRSLGNPANFVVTPGGNVSYFNVTTNPILGSYSGIGGNGVAVSIATLAPCGQILPHIHPRGAKAIYLISGKILVGRIQENKADPIITIMNPGDITFVPRGALHFVQSLSCGVSQQHDAYNTEDPGLLTFGLNLFRFPDMAPESGFGIPKEYVEYVRQFLPGAALNPTAACLAACQAGRDPATDYPNW
eukprot:Phypoly_transcript_17778.p1 GENE.Phypoly_transcript_17778~~Phypoly_transcript_17778.p1  ORF type:complete len:226 (+),score=38.66 Phypoly_transcript_17778:87-764(+)